MQTLQKTLTTALAALCALGLIGCANTVDTAQTRPVMKLEYKDYAEYSPFFAHQGDTVYVSGDATQWLSQLKQTLFYLKQLRKDGVTYSDPTIQKPVSHIVFVGIVKLI